MAKDSGKMLQHVWYFKKLRGGSLQHKNIADVPIPYEREVSIKP